MKRFKTHLAMFATMAIVMFKPSKWFRRSLAAGSIILTYGTVIYLLVNNGILGRRVNEWEVYVWAPVTLCWVSLAFAWKRSSMAWQGNSDRWRMLYVSAQEQLDRMRTELYQRRQRDLS